MPDQAIRVPMPLSSVEIKNGIADGMHRAIRESLDKTCSLNSTTFPQFRAKWWVEYELDDFGRIETGGIGGSIGQVGENAERIEGAIEPMPPDAFRRKSNQPIPSPVIFKKKDVNEPVITKTAKHSVKGKDA
jgi:hypothetical protein